MKTIKEYINNDNWQPTLRPENSNEYFYEQLEDFYGNDHIPSKYVKLFEDRTLYKLGYDYINENLKTHDYKKLQNKLLEYYSDDIESFKEYEGNDKIKSFYIILKNNSKILTIKNLKKKDNNEIEIFFNILSFFNYTYREYEKVNSQIGLFIEPIYSEDASSYFDKCHRQAYHFTYKTNVDKILKNGIKIRERNSVIKYPKRIYIWASDKKINKSEINDFIKTLFGYEFDENKIGIIKIDLYNTNYPVYKDTAMKEKEALFVCNSIPANLCKEIKI